MNMKTNESETLTHHPMISREHLNRMAIIYARQSSQLPEKTGRRDLQLNQLQLARQYRRPDHLIVLIDEDMGKPGSSVEHRSGYQRMLDQITTGGVGAIFAASVSRLSRCVIEYEHLRILASDHGTVLCIGGEVIDPSSSK
jgi:DNA invertase Pin-like site-specific DNA recombinase